MVWTTSRAVALPGLGRAQNIWLIKQKTQIDVGIYVVTSRRLNCLNVYVGGCNVGDVLFTDVNFYQARESTCKNIARVSGRNDDVISGYQLVKL